MASRAIEKRIVQLVNQRYNSVKSYIKKGEKIRFKRAIKRKVVADLYSGRVK